VLWDRDGQDGTGLVLVCNGKAHQDIYKCMHNWWVPVHLRKIHSMLATECLNRQQTWYGTVKGGWYCEDWEETAEVNQAHIVLVPN
jgi:hypothetical protein